VSYDLEAVAPDPPRAPLDLDALVALARGHEAVLAHASVQHAREAALYACCDGEGFALEATPRGAKLCAGPSRGASDEWLMERVALAIAGPHGEVVDRHTGRRWTALLLREWLEVSALFSGRALAANEARISRRGTDPDEPVRGFADRVARVAAHVSRGEGSHELVARLREELGHYASRPAFAWPVARALATMGDFSRLEVLTRASAANGGETDAFVVAAEYGAAAVPLFARALDDADPNHRRAAARALHRIAAPEVLPLAARALEDKRSTVREAVLEAGLDAMLALDGGPRVLGPLITRLARDSNSTVRRLAARYRA
jgi:hypothetical protein